jgi:hypothetical protein
MPGCGPGSGPWNTGPVKSRVRMLAGLFLLLAAGCGSTTTISRTTPLPPAGAPTASAPRAAPPVRTPLTPTATSTTPTVSCGSVAQGAASEIAASGIPCSTAQATAAAWVTATSSGGQATQGTVSVSAAGTQFSCSSMVVGGQRTVTCDSPGIQSAVTFKARG